MEKIEDIINRHSQRGMEKLRAHLPADYCRQTAAKILDWERGTVFLTTGFYVASFPETDGPSGTTFVALALKKLGFNPIIVTDSAYAGLFTIRDIEVIGVAVADGEPLYRELLEKYKPVGLISIERCGLNINDDYANMRGISIKEHNAKVDYLFMLAPEFGIPSVGVGDGGNEIGMGVFAEVIQKELSLVPCKIKVDDMIIASVSNWGSYGLVAYLAILSGESVFPSYPEVRDYIRETVEVGSVDGVTHERVPHVDNFGEDVEQEIVEALESIVNISFESISWERIEYEKSRLLQRQV